MNRLARAMGRAQRDLDQLGVTWALVGGFALSVRVEPRMTRDIDVAVAVTGDAQAEQIVFSLRQRGYRDPVGGMVLEQTAKSRLATIRLLCPEDVGSTVVLDLLFASSGIEPELAAEAEKLAIVPGLVVPVARNGHLLALKVLAARDQDLADARALARRATPDERARARRAVALIVQRGFDRAGPEGRDLARELEGILSG